MSLPALWEGFLLQLEEALGVETVRKWLRPLRILRYDAGNLYLQISDSFQAMWFEEHVRSRALSHLRNHNGRVIRVHLVPQQESAPEVEPEPKPSRTVPPKRKPPLTTPRMEGDGLAPDASFAHLVSHPGIEIPLRVLQEIGQGAPLEGEQALGFFNPVYLYGSSGSGKTLLLQACARAMMERGCRALYCRADTFTEHVIAAIRAGEMQSFRRAYRNVGALLVDDVQGFSRKTSTQEEFFHTFNTLHLEGHQIILASSCPPSELQAVEPRLISRFEWGLVLPLQAPEPDQLRSILLSRAQAMSWPASGRLLDWLVEAFPSSPKAAVRACEALVLRAHLEQLAVAQVTPERAAHLLQDLLAEERHASLTPAKILQAVAEQFGMPLDELTGDSQTRECVVPRQLAMFLCRQKLRLPYMRIGELFGRDHSTVISAIKVAQKMLEDPGGDLARQQSGAMKRLELLRKVGSGVL